MLLKVKGSVLYSKSYKSNTSLDYFYIRNSFFLQNNFEQAIRESFQSFANCPTWDLVLS